MKTMKTLIIGIVGLGIGSWIGAADLTHRESAAYIRGLNEGMAEQKTTDDSRIHHYEIIQRYATLLRLDKDTGDTCWYSISQADDGLQYRMPRCSN